MNIIDETNCKIITPEALTACAEGFISETTKIEPAWYSALIVRKDGKCCITNREIVTTIEKNSCIRIEYNEVSDSRLYVFPHGSLTIPCKTLIAALKDAPSIPLADFLGARRGYNHRLLHNEWLLQEYLEHGEK